MYLVLGVVGATVGLFVGTQMGQCAEKTFDNFCSTPPPPPEMALLMGAIGLGIGLGIGLLIAAAFHLIARLRRS